MTGYALGKRFWFIPANTNTGATTINITPSGGSALGARNIFSMGVALIGGELRAGVPIAVIDDGTRLSIVGPTTPLWDTFAPTPTLVGGAGNTVPVYVTNSGRVFRHGNKASVKIYLAGDGGAEGAGTGVLNIALPFAVGASAQGNYFVVGIAFNGANQYILVGTLPAGATVLKLNYFNTISTQTDFTGALQNNTTREITLSFEYEV